MLLIQVCFLYNTVESQLPINFVKGDATLPNETYIKVTTGDQKLAYSKQFPEGSPNMEALLGT